MELWPINIINTIFIIICIIIIGINIIFFDINNIFLMNTQYIFNEYSMQQMLVIILLMILKLLCYNNNFHLIFTDFFYKMLNH